MKPPGGRGRNLPRHFATRPQDEPIRIFGLPVRKGLHSPKLTWKPIWSPFRRTVVFIGPFLGFHVSFRECRPRTADDYRDQRISEQKDRDRRIGDGTRTLHWGTRGAEDQSTREPGGQRTRGSEPRLTQPHLGKTQQNLAPYTALTSRILNPQPSTPKKAKRPNRSGALNPKP